MKKILLGLALLAGFSVWAENIINAPKIQNQPDINSVQPELWGSYTAENGPLSLYAVYDQKNLYLSFDVAQTDPVYAGNGRGVVFHNDCIELHIDRGNNILHVYADAGNMLHIMEGGWTTTRAGEISSRSRIYEGKGFRIFIRIPWNRIDRANGKPRDVAFKFTHNHTTSPLRYQRKDYEFTLKLADNTVPCQQLCGMEYINQRMVNFGRPGFNSRELHALLPYILDYNPELAIVMIGTNDIVWRKKWQTPDEYILYVRKLCEELLQNNCKIILVTIPPCIPENVAARENTTPEETAALSVKVDAFNARLRALGSEFNIPVADYNALFVGDIRSKDSLLRNVANCGSADGVHPSEEGYRVLAELLKKVIDENNLPINRIACLGDSITFGSAMLGQGSCTGDTYPGRLSALLYAE